MTSADLVQIWHTLPDTLRRWSNEGRIRAYRITNRGDRRYKREETVRFLDELNGHGNGDQEA